MNILIVEDEPPIAEYIQKCTRSILGGRIKELYISYSLQDALINFDNHNIDLCLLDLNLSGEDGFEFLKKSMSRPFHTIIISAHTDRAIQAFEYGVIDFVPKSFNLDRLKKAFDRYFGRIQTHAAAKYLVCRKQNSNFLVPAENVVYIKAARYLVEVHLADDDIELLEKPLNRLEQILPENFIRIHRSYIVNINCISSFKHAGGSVYQLQLKNGEILPISRYRFKKVKNLLENH